MPTSFWDWSLSIYPAVQADCLRLQDEGRFEVNGLLWCGYCAARGLDPVPAFPAAIVLVQAWSPAVAQLRAARRAMKAPPIGIDAFGANALRQQIIACERQAERLLQDGLGALTTALLGKPANVDGLLTDMQAFGQALGADIAHPALKNLAETLLRHGI